MPKVDLSDKTFLGLPIKGEIYAPSLRVAQRPAEELAPLIEAVTSHPEVLGVRWKQYIPYFNDGDPCVFSAFLIGVETAASRGTEQGDYGDGFLGSYYIPDGPLQDAFQELYNAISSGAYDDSLASLFGEHSIVTVRPGEAIEVEFYDHN